MWYSSHVFHLRIFGYQWAQIWCNFITLTSFKFYLVFAKFWTYFDNSSLVGKFSICHKWQNNEESGHAVTENTNVFKEGQCSRDGPLASNPSNWSRQEILPRKNFRPWNEPLKRSCWRSRWPLRIRACSGRRTTTELWCQFRCSKIPVRATRKWNAESDPEEFDSAVVGFFLVVEATFWPHLSKAWAVEFHLIQCRKSRRLSPMSTIKTIKLFPHELWQYFDSDTIITLTNLILMCTTQCLFI